MAGAEIEQARAHRRAHLGRQHGGLCLGLRPRRRGGAGLGAAAARHAAARHHGRAGAAGAPHQRCRRDLQRRQRAHDPRPLHPAARGRAGRGRRLLRPSPDDGSRRAGRRGCRSDARRRRPDPRPAERGSRRRAPRSCGSTIRMPSLQDRTVTTGIVSPELVRQYAAGGFVGRASGRAFDARKNFAYAPYDRRGFRPQDADRGRRRRAPAGAHGRDRREPPDPFAAAGSAGAGRRSAPTARPLTAGEGAALVEAFRGDVFVSVRLAADGRLARVHARDASWFQWPLLEAAVEGNIVADFPLCNKSFNCSYSGHDL